MNGFSDVKTFSIDDGSRSIKAVQIDSSATGNNFNTAGTMINNGETVRAVCRAPYPHTHSCFPEP